MRRIEGGPACDWYLRQLVRARLVTWIGRWQLTAPRVSPAAAWELWRGIVQIYRREVRAGFVGE